MNLGLGVIDGIAADGEGALLVSHNEGRILRVTPDGRVDTVLDTTAIRVNAADFAYVADLKLAVIPTFATGRVVAYRLGATPSRRACMRSSRVPCAGDSAISASSGTRR